MRRRKSLLVALTVALVAGGGLAGVAVAAPGSTYYVDNRPGCSNTGPGQQIATPWCDFTPVNAREYGPGDRILLARGARWNQQLNLRGKGTATDPVVLDAYGSGPRPHIRRDGRPADRGVRLANPSHWRVGNLEVSHAGAGIVAYFDQLGNEGLTISDIFVHDISGVLTQPWPCKDSDGIFSSAGIAITGPALRFTAAEYALKDVLIRNIEGTRNLGSVSFDWCNGQSGSDGHDGNSLVRNVVLDGLNLHDDAGAGQGCHDSLRLVNLRQVVVLNSVLRREAGCPIPSGTAAVFLGRVLDIRFLNSIVAEVPDTGSPDQTGFDHEIVTDSVRLQNNLIASNAGPGVEYLAIHGPADHSRGHEISGNLFLDNAKANQPAHLGGIARIHHMIRPTGTIRGNLFHEPTGFTRSADGGNFDGFDIRDNVELHSIGDSFHAPSAFAATSRDGWSYQQSADGSTWRELPFDQVSGQYRGTGGAAVERFTQTPPDCAGCWTARTWTAPKAGTISLRSRALKAEAGGDGVRVRLTVNGRELVQRQVGPADLHGVELNADRLVVAPGDVLRFEVNPDGSSTADRTSWAPALGYLAEPSRWWRFDQDTEGWRLWHQLTGSVRDGVLTMESAGNDPFLFSPDNLGLDAASQRFVELRLRNGTRGTAAQIYFITEDDRTWSEDKQVTLRVAATERTFEVHRLDLGAHPKWRGRIKQLRIDPSVAAGKVELDYVRVG
ncbi:MULTISPECIES: hypothetical protein [unclassified Crossiella]|uniref:hypothetical protein n=1 Tax=unclassified Crossiella TaxID=2620835 RepID=UPI001FFEDA0F|nr:MULTISPECIES: hypothetical protein [unclassified Crossiella]MCK2245184.1 hypothetical protein [Crossiella sp. S99.2]MCK2258837.1 hypothetical protein [Crossiella sp. S99.1]